MNDLIKPSLSYADLNHQYQNIKPQLSNDNKVRLHRALSWLKRAEQEEMLDSQFIFLWISFNAAYAQDGMFDKTERDHFHQFFDRIVSCDSDKTLFNVLTHIYSGPIRLLLDNKFAFQPFWNALREHDSSDNWKTLHEILNKQALRLHFSQELNKAIEIIFERLYTLRNQLIHGGATYGSHLNREQLQNATQILADILPIMIEIMIHNPQVDFGEIAYPVV